MKKLTYEVGTKKTHSYTKALEFARVLGKTIKTIYEEVEEPVQMTDKQRENRVKVGAR